MALHHIIWNIELEVNLIVDEEREKDKFSLGNTEFEA